MSEDVGARAAEVARALSEGMNLLFFFAAPRVLVAVRASGGLDEPTMLASLRRFLSVAAGIRARHRAEEPAPGDDVQRLTKLAMIVEEIAGELGARPLAGGDALPGTVVGRAREALSIFGMQPPPGGWETFEGFTLPSPPPSAS